MLERIGHVLWMRNERLTKAIMLGWYEGLEGRTGCLALEIRKNSGKKFCPGEI